MRSYPSPLFVTLPYPFAMQDRPRRLGKVAVAGRPVALTPGATMGMPVGVQVPEPQPAAIVTARMGTTMPGGVKHTRAAMGRRHGSGAERGGALGSVASCAQAAQRGFGVRPSKALGAVARLRLHGGGTGCADFWGDPVDRLGQPSCNITQSHRPPKIARW